MIRFLADENFDRHIVRGLRRRLPNIDIALAQEVGLTGIDDAVLLDWAATEQRLVLSHDRKTLIRHAWDRVRSGRRVSGVLLVSRKAPIRVAMEALILIAECSRPEEWEGVVDYLPATGW